MIHVKKAKTKKKFLISLQLYKLQNSLPLKLQLRKIHKNET